MGKLRNGKTRVFFTAAAILIASAAVFIVAIQIAMGAEEDKVVQQPSGNLEVALPAETQQPSAEATPAATETPAATAVAVQPSTAPRIDDALSFEGVAPSARKELTAEGKAVAACLKVATDLFGMNVDESSLKVTFNPKEDIKDENGNVVYTTHEGWAIECADFFCGVDAATDTVISFMVESNKYTGSSITLNDFDNNNTTGVIPGGGPANLQNSPDDIYIKAARQLVTDRLADGRSIQDIQIDGVQFVWDNNDLGFDPNATGTALVDCHVYMDTGLSYTLSFLGTDQLILHWFMSHPSHHACMWGYFYPEDSADYPPEGVTAGEWYEAQDINGTYSDNGATSRPSAIPGS